MREIRKGAETLTEVGTPKRPIAAAVLCAITSGIALGAVVGPVGVFLGALLGIAVGFIAGHVLARDEAKRSRRMRELDAIIGITNGSIGVGPITIVNVEEEDDGPIYSSREAWAAEWLTPPPPSVG